MVRNNFTIINTYHHGNNTLRFKTTLVFPGPSYLIGIFTYLKVSRSRDPGLVHIRVYQILDNFKNFSTDSEFLSKGNLHICHFCGHKG